jgi:hypothetical protein
MAVVLLLSNGQKDHSVQQPEGDEVGRISFLAWQRLPGSERIRAVMDLNLDLYAMKGQAADAPRLQRTVIRFQRRTG